MEELFHQLLILCPLVFVAGLVDSIAGGGGLISLPAYLLAGLPIHIAYGTNKFAMAFGTFFSAVRFFKNGQIHYKSSIIAASTALLGSYLGAKAALALDEIYLKYSLIVLLPVITIFILLRKNFGKEDTTFVLSGKKIIVLSAIVGLIIGTYDGFFGPGTGAFLVLVFTGVIGFNLILASGNAKFVNLASNIAALITFLAEGKVLFFIGIPAALSAILGNWIGAGLAIKNGAKIIRPVFMLVLASLFVKIGLDFLK